MNYKERDLLYRLIISQLYYDGYQTMALSLMNMVSPSQACGPSNRLLKLIQLGLSIEEDERDRDRGVGNLLDAETIAPGTGIDLDVETESSAMSPEASLYETCYVTSHKAACRAAVFNATGQLVATGSEDSSIKILDVERMLTKSVTPMDSSQPETTQQQMESHPVIRTLYDHQSEVTCLDFHPDHTQQILVSGSKDYTIKIFDFTNPSVKKAQKNIPEASPIRTLHMHPSGNFLLVGTQHPTLRLYDVNTCQCFVSSVPEDQHNGAVSMARWSPNANYFVTASKDGAIKIWDGVSCRCISTFEKAHEGYEVCSTVFSRNSKYVLSAGKDSVVKLWELSTGRCLISYTGAGTTGRQTHRSTSVFNHTEDYARNRSMLVILVDNLEDLLHFGLGRWRVFVVLAARLMEKNKLVCPRHRVSFWKDFQDLLLTPLVLFPDEATKSLCCWDSRNADRQRLLSLNHNGPIRTFVHSPTTAAFMSCSDDFRARFWYKRPISD